MLPPEKLLCSCTHQSDKHGPCSELNIGPFDSDLEAVQNSKLHLSQNCSCQAWRTCFGGRKWLMWFGYHHESVSLFVHNFLTDVP
jgi:hypothetical protein